MDKDFREAPATSSEASPPPEWRRASSPAPEMPKPLLCAWGICYLILAVAALYGVVLWAGGGFWTVVFYTLVGGLIGYSTNLLALKMLFCPKREIRFPRFPAWFFPNRMPAGLIVKRQPDIARIIGDFSREHLLSRRAVRTHMKRVDLRGMIADWLFEKSALWPDGDRLSAMELAAVAGVEGRLAPDAERFARGLAASLADRLLEHARTRQFRKNLANWVDSQVRRYSSRKLRDLIGVDDRRRLAAAVAALAARELGGADGRAVCSRAARTFLEGLERGGAERLLDNLGGRAERALPGLVGEHAGALAAYLEKPEVARPLREALRVEIGAKLRALLRQNLGPLLRAPGLTDMAVDGIIQGLSLDDAVGAFLRDNWRVWLAKLTDAIREQKGEIAAQLSSEGGAWLRGALARGIPEDLRAEAGREAARLMSECVGEFLASDAAVQAIAAKLDEWSARSLDDLCPNLVDEAIGRITGGIEDALDFLADPGDTRRDRFLETVGQICRSVLTDVRFPNPWAEKPPAERRRICKRLARFLDVMLRKNIPGAIEKLNLGNMVEQELLGFTPVEIEQLAVQTSKREMRYIEVIGGVAGAAAAGILQVLTLLI